MKITRVATRRANPISWVTTIIVMPSFASPVMTSSTSEIISGPSADVGSSKSIASGSIASARAIATRCCSPPESCPGYFAACCVSPTRSRSFIDRAVASSRERPRTRTWPRLMLSTTLMCGNSSKCWKTMPIWARRRVRLVFGSPTEMPLTSTSPRWNGSSPLTVLIKVLLPEPEGPHTTTTSPLFTAAEQSFSTCTGPYHLLTSFISIIAMTAPSRSRALPARNRQPELELLHEARHAEADREIDRRDEQVHLDQAAVSLGDLRGGAEEIGDREHVDERGVLEQDDGLRQEHR